MSADQQESSEPGSPITWMRDAVTGAWRDLKSVYYANTTIWRLLKSATLLFFGFFLWTGANLLLSYRADWEFLYYVMAYGFVLLLWGPLTHLVVVPLVIRMRRSSTGRIGRYIARHGSVTNLSIFLAIVLVLGTFPLGVMTFEFQLTGGAGNDVNPQLQCTKSAGTVHCHLSESSGIDRVVVTSGDQELEAVSEPPFHFDIDVDEVGEVRGDKQFLVVLQDENGDTLRRYSRRVELIPG